MSIEQEITSWDGKSLSDVHAIYKRHCDDDLFASILIELSTQENLQRGTTWLLKRYLNNKHRLNADEVAAIYSRIHDFGHWEAKLHILQCIPEMPIGETEKKSVEIFLRKCLAEKNKFVRAWAYNGFYEISLQYPEYKKETIQIFEMAMRDEAPSVKARIRNIMKNGF